MKVKELIEKLSEFNPEMEAWWHDAIEGNDSPVESVWVGENTVVKQGQKETLKGVVISPRSES